MTSKILYTLTDEAPLLATASFLPVVQAYARSADVAVETRDISLAARIVAQFNDMLPEDQRNSDDLTELGKLATTPEANIIKLPNISASVPQLKAAIKELQAHGYALPDYPDEPQGEREKDIKSRYGKSMGSAVNPVLREGNSDRRAPASVKAYARKHPHRMGKWDGGSLSHVTYMEAGDFYGSEQSYTMINAGSVRIEYTSATGSSFPLRGPVALQAGEVIDASVMSVQALADFVDAQIQDAKARGVLFSLHLKATMMKVSDPIMFGIVVSRFYAPVLEKHPKTLAEIGFNPNNGIGDLYAKLGQLDDTKRAEIEADIAALYAQRPGLAMVNSDKGITNLHVPSDIIVDASMPAMIRDSGKMWNAAGELQDTKAVIPDRNYAGIYQVVIDDCREHGAFDPATMGSVPNVGLMAQAAEEYGSHDKTFKISGDGTVRGPDPRLGEVGSEPRTLVEYACGVLAGSAPRPRPRPGRQGHDLPQRTRHHWPGHQHPQPDPRDAAFAQAHPRRQGHDCRNRQRVARLPDRPVSDHGAWHQREDAVDRAADGRWRPVRNRCRRQRTQACAAVRRRGLPALGFAG